MIFGVEFEMNRRFFKYVNKNKKIFGKNIF